MYTYTQYILFLLSAQIDSRRNQIEFHKVIPTRIIMDIDLKFLMHQFRGIQNWQNQPVTYFGWNELAKAV